MMPRPQFTLRALLVAMLVVGAFFGGAAWQRLIDSAKITREQHCGLSPIVKETLTTPDGRKWIRFVRVDE